MERVVCVRPENFGYMTYIKKKEVDGRCSRERARASYAKNAENIRERRRILYEKKQASLGKITKRSLMKETMELRRKQQIAPNLPIIPQ